MRIVQVCMQCPYPPNSGERLRNWSLIRELSARHRVHLITLQKPGDDDAEAVDSMREYCTEVEVVCLRLRSKLAHLPGLLLFARTGQPLENKFFFLPEVYERVSRAAQGGPDVLQIDHSYMAGYLAAAGNDYRGQTVLSLADVQSVRLQRLAAIERHPLKRLRLLLAWKQMCRWERRMAPRFGACVVTSRVEAEALRAVAAGVSPAVVPNGVDVEALRPLPASIASMTILFVGSLDYLPNVDGVIWFCRTAMPRIRKVVPEAELLVVGRKPRGDLRELERFQGVALVGEVQDVRPFYERSAVCVVPLRAGGGTRLKILEAMALGRPVVSTAAGCEGIDAADREELLIADDPEGLAAGVTSLLVDPDRAGRLCERARRLVEDRYSWASIAEKLEAVYARAPQPSPRLEVDEDWAPGLGPGQVRGRGKDEC